MSSALRVLIIEDSVEDTFFVVRELQRGGYNVAFERVETHNAMQSALQSNEWDLIICDYSMPQFSGPGALALYRQSGQDIPFIMVSGAMGEELAVEMVKAGAHDYVMKDNLSRLVPAVKRELEAAQERRLRRQAEGARAYMALLVQSCDDAIVGTTLDGTIVTWNAGAERLFGYAAVEVIDRPISVLLPAERRDELQQTLGAIQRGEYVQAFRTVRMRKDGSQVEVVLTLSPIRDGEGRLIGASTVARQFGPQNLGKRESLAPA